jgi:hypothetical protein
MQRWLTHYVGADTSYEGREGSWRYYVSDSDITNIIKKHPGQATGAGEEDGNTMNDPCLAN